MKLYYRRLKRLVCTALVLGYGTIVVQGETVTANQPLTAIPRNIIGATVTENQGITTINFGNKDVIVDHAYMANVLGKSNGNGNLVLVGNSFKLKTDATLLGYGLAAPTVSLTDGDTITVNGNMDIIQRGDKYGVAGIAATPSGVGAGKATSLTINGNVTMKEGGNPGVTAQIKSGGIPNYMGSRWAPVGINLGTSHGSVMNINGNVDLYVDGTGVQTDPFYKSPGIADKDLAIINIKGGTIRTPETPTFSHYSLASYGGSININMENGTAGRNNVTLVGNVIAAKEHNGSGGEYFYRNGTINIGLNTPNSSWKGVIDNFGATHAGDVNLFIGNGATWTHANASRPNGMDSNSMPAPSNSHYGQYDGISYINRLVGNKSQKGSITMKDGAPIYVNTYEGAVDVIYEHKNDGSLATDYGAGDFVVLSAKKDSAINLITDNSNINMQNDTTVAKALNGLAGKLVYPESVSGIRNLAGTVTIASGLTASSASLKVGDISYDTDEGRGYYVASPVNPPVNPPVDPPVNPPVKPPVVSPIKPPVMPPITQGSVETPIMKGIRSAITDSVLQWRHNMLSHKHLFKWRDRKETGFWATISGGKFEYAGNQINIDSDYKAYQLGYDTQLKNGWVAGIEVTHQRGNSEYVYGGSGDTRLTTLGAYATKQMKDNSYVALAVKGGKLWNDLTAFNEIGWAARGSYKTNAYGISGEYGKRFAFNKTYIEPQVQFALSRVSGNNFDVRRGNDVLSVDQDAFNSIVGRLGIEVGSHFNKGTVYGRLNVNHEFSGELHGTYSAKDGGEKSTTVDLDDTWTDITVGANYDVGVNTNVYVEVSKGLSGDYQKDWDASFGIKHKF